MNLNQAMHDMGLKDSVESELYSDAELKQECKLFIGNIPVDVIDQQTLYNIFMSEGQIKEIYYHPPKPPSTRTWSFITYYCLCDALKAIEEYNRKMPHHFKVEISKQKPRMERNTSSETQITSSESTPRNLMTTQASNTKFRSPMKDSCPTETGSTEKNFHMKVPTCGQSSSAVSDKPAVLTHVENFNGPSDQRQTTERMEIPFTPLADGQCIITAFVAPHVFVRPSDRRTNQKLQLIQDGLSYHRPSLEALDHEPQNGELVAAEYDDGDFYRAIILNVNHGQGIKVQYIDFGNISYVRTGDLKKLPRKFEGELCLSVKVHIEDELTEGKKELIEEYLQNELTIRVVMDATEEGRLSLCTPILTMTGKISEKFSYVRVGRIRDTIFTLSDMTREDWVIDSQVEILVHDVMSCNTIAASLLKSKVMNDLQCYQEAINLYCEAQTPYAPSKDELCLTQVNDLWYRSCCVARQRFTITALLLDTSETKTVKYCNIRRIPRDLAIPPMAGAICSIKMNVEKLSKKNMYAVYGYLKMTKKLKVTVICNHDEGYVISVKDIDSLIEE